jgi:uncharacterized membrane protein
MNKKQFFDELNEYLLGIPKADKEEILQDYGEHFRVGKKKKRSEANIVKSLGEPKQIAREIRAELSSSEKKELESEAIETWVAVKKFSKHLFNEAKDKIEDVIQKGKEHKKHSNVSKWILIGLIAITIILIFNSLFFKFVALVVLGYFVFKYIQEKESPEVKSKNSDEKSSSRLVISLIFNVLFFIWFWVYLLFMLLGLFIYSFAIIISGAAIFGFTIFALLSHNNPLTRSVLFSGLFAGLGILILGDLFMRLSKWVIKLFFKLTKQYVELNNRFIRK